MDEEYGQLIEPAKVPFSFGAPGWYVLLTIVLLVLILTGWLALRFYRRNLYRRIALRQLKELTMSATMDKTDLPAIIFKTNMLMKRIAIYKYGRTEAASARNEDWINYLNSHSVKEIFTAEDTELLNQQLYGGVNTNPSNPDLFFEKSKQWIRKHKHRVKPVQHKIAQTTISN